MKKSILLRAILALNLFTSNVNAQLADSCKLIFGTNLAGLADWGTELPFVDMMKNCRTWYSKDANNPNESPFDTEAADSISYRADGYPTQIPQTIPHRTFTQKVSTVWAITDGWEAGHYIVLFDGNGTLDFWGGLSDLTHPSANRYTFDFNDPIGSILELTIETSNISDPVRNIRVIRDIYESTYLTQPFNQDWIEKLQAFRSVRFMDWGSTNNWGQIDEWTWEGTSLFEWNDRAKPDYYTWATNKGIPYEMMIKLMNDFNFDGWVCVPHRASNSYIQQMAQLFHTKLEPERELTVEYSNEIWNWMFGQTQWLYEYGCILQSKDWPEGIVPYIQNCLDIWALEYGSDLDRIKRIVGLQTGWFDVSQRIAINMRPNSFDAVAPTYYFGLSSETLEAELDALGANATVSDVVSRVRASSNENEKVWMQAIKTDLADELNLPMAFYEGGQHITPNPFGDEPTYAQALLDIQRDTAMYNLYTEWFDFLRTLQSGNKPLECMNYSFIGGLSARYGSWGILETLNQDTALIPAPKYKAIIDNQHLGCFEITAINKIDKNSDILVYPNPTCDFVVIENKSSNQIEDVIMTDLSGKTIFHQKVNGNTIRIDSFPKSRGVYLLIVKTRKGKALSYKILKE
jgi:hypothetical protein